MSKMGENIFLGIVISQQNIYLPGDPCLGHDRSVSTTIYVQKQQYPKQDLSVWASEA